MPTALVLEDTVGPHTLDGKGDILVATQLIGADVNRGDFPAPALSVAGVHPEQVTREEGRLVTTGAGPDLDDGMPGLIRIGGQQSHAQVLLNGGQPGFQFFQLHGRHFAQFGPGFLAPGQLTVIANIGQGAGVSVSQRAQFAQRAVLRDELAVAFLVRGRAGFRHFLLQGGQAPQNLLDIGLVDHRRHKEASSRDVIPPTWPRTCASYSRGCSAC